MHQTSPNIYPLIQTVFVFFCTLIKRVYVVFLLYLFTTKKSVQYIQIYKELELRKLRKIICHPPFSPNQKKNIN